jgi:hypothetical protein
MSDSHCELTGLGVAAIQTLFLIGDLRVGDLGSGSELIRMWIYSSEDRRVCLLRDTARSELVRSSQWLGVSGVMYIGPSIIWTLIRFGAAMIQEVT